MDLGSDPIPITPPQTTLYTLATSNSIIPSTAGATTTGDGSNGLMTCLPFHWYLSEVYPGLAHEAQSVQHQFQEYLGTEYLTSNAMISKLMTEYAKEGGDHASAHASAEDLSLLQSRQTKLLNNAHRALELKLDGKLLSKHMFKPPIRPKGPSLKDLSDLHAADVRDHLTCSDLNLAGGTVADLNDPRYSCAKRMTDAANGGAGQNWCEMHKADVIFICPKTCGFCDVSDGSFCEDFFLKKCPIWKGEGKCGTEDNKYGKYNDVCRKSCGVCKPLAEQSEWKQEQEQKMKQLKGQQQSSAQHAKQQPPPPPSKPAVVDTNKPAGIERPHALSIPTVEDSADSADMPTDPILRQFKAPMTIDPNKLHREYIAGNMPDRVSSFGDLVKTDDQCTLKGKPEGKMLTHVKQAGFDSIHSPYHHLAGHEPGTSLDSDGNQLRIFCGIYTMEKNHKTNVEATRTTWAKRCDGFIAFSTVEDTAIPSINILHEGDEAYDNMWQKSRSIWRYIYNHLRNDYDFFLLGGDDMFYIIENLRAYLGSEEITHARKTNPGLYIGRIFQPPKQIVFNSGGAGYILDSKALNVLGENIDGPKCFPHQRGFWEDVNVANCLKSSDAHIVPYQTRDPQDRERFHPFTPGMHLTYRIPKNPDWYAKYNPYLKVGYDCCSEGSVSFHYVPEKLMYKLYNFLYHCEHK